MIGERIKARREALGFTQEELAEKINMTVVTISRYENNAVDYSVKKLDKMAAALNCTTADFFVDQKRPRQETDFMFIPVVNLKTRKPKNSYEVVEEIIDKFPIKNNLLLQKDEQLKVCIINGDALAQKYHDGDFALYTNKIDEIAKGDLVATIFDGKFYVRYYYQNSDGTIDLLASPETKEYPPIHTSRDDTSFILIGKIIRVFHTIKNTGLYG